MDTAGKKYNLDKNQLIAVIHQLFTEPNLCFEDEQTVWRAFHDYRLATPVKIGSKRKMADFPDALIINKSAYCTKLPETLKGVYTFDKAALMMTVLPFNITASKQAQELWLG